MRQNQATRHIRSKIYAKTTLSMYSKQRIWQAAVIYLASPWTILHALTTAPVFAQARPTPDNSFIVTDPVSGNQYKIDTYGGPSAPSRNSTDNSTRYKASFQNAYYLSDNWITSPSNLIWGGDYGTKASNDAAYEAARGWANRQNPTGDLIGFATYGKPGDSDVWAFFGAEGYLNLFCVDWRFLGYGPKSWCLA